MSMEAHIIRTCAVIFRMLFLLCFGCTAEARYLMDLIRERLHR